MDRHQFAKWITKRNIVSRTETIVKPRNGNDALAARDSVCKFLYARLFDWLVAKVMTIENSLFVANSNSYFAGAGQRLSAKLDRPGTLHWLARYLRFRDLQAKQL